MSGSDSGGSQAASHASTPRNSKRRDEWKQYGKTENRTKCSKLLKRTVAVHARSLGLATLEELTDAVIEDDDTSHPITRRITRSRSRTTLPILNVKDNAYSPYKPRIRSNEVKFLSKNIDIALLSSTDVSPRLAEELQENKSYNFTKKYLADFPRR